MVLGPGVPGHLNVRLGLGKQQFVVDVPSDRIPSALRLPNSCFVAAVVGRELIRVEPAGRTWITIQDEIRSILNADWDPIGVSDIVDDEYDAYIGHIYSMLANSGSEQAVADYLLSIERDRMSLQGTPTNQRLSVAAKLRKLKLPSANNSGPQN